MPTACRHACGCGTSAIVRGCTHAGALSTRGKWASSPWSRWAYSCRVIRCTPEVRSSWGGRVLLGRVAVAARTRARPTCTQARRLIHWASVSSPTGSWSRLCARSGLAGWPWSRWRGSLRRWVRACTLRAPCKVCERRARPRGKAATHTLRPRAHAGRCDAQGPSGEPAGLPTAFVSCAAQAGRWGRAPRRRACPRARSCALMPLLAW